MFLLLQLNYCNARSDANSLCGLYVAVYFLSDLHLFAVCAQPSMYPTVYPGKSDFDHDRMIDDRCQ